MVLDELSAVLGKLFKQKAKAVKRTIFWVKLLLVALGAFISSAAAFFSTDTLLPLSTPQVIGLTGLFLVLVGTVFIIITEDDSAEALEQARHAVDEAARYSSTAREVYDELLTYDDAVDRLSALYYVMSLGRGTVEQAVLRGVVNETTLIRACLKSCQRELKVALGFEIGDVWTICIYRARAVDGEPLKELELIAHDRSVDCDIEKARRWREGVGVGGIALAKNDEVVVPDLDDPAIGNVFKLDGDLAKPEDSDRYKSIFAVPIEVGSDQHAWGVVLATSNIPDYFGADDNVGVDPEEAVRALAGLIALSVAVCRTNHGHNDAQE